MIKQPVIVKRIVNGKKCSVLVNRTETVDEYKARVYGPQPLPTPPPTILPASPVKVKNRQKKIKRKRRTKELQKLSKHQLIAIINGLESAAEAHKKQQSEAQARFRGSPDDPNDFYASPEWRALRYRALKTYGRVCALCRSTEGEMHVDHIKPRSLYPELALVFENLQVLCKPCNLGKSNRDETDWRRSG